MKVDTVVKAKKKLEELMVIYRNKEKELDELEKKISILEDDLNCYEVDYGFTIVHFDVDEGFKVAAIHGDSSFKNQVAFNLLQKSVDRCNKSNYAEEIISPEELEQIVSDHCKSMLDEMYGG